MLTGLELEFPAQNVHQELDHGVHGCESIREEDEPNDDRELLVKSERLVKGAVVDKDRKKGENIECVELGRIRNCFSFCVAGH